VVFDVQTLSRDIQGNHVAYNKEQVREAYRLADIDRNTLSDAQRRLLDKIITLLITKCNQQDLPISSMTEAFEEIKTLIKEDPLLS